MSNEKEPTQKTPEGAEIPIPKRGDFLKNLLKTAKKPAALNSQPPEGVAVSNCERSSRRCE